VGTVLRAVTLRGLSVPAAAIKRFVIQFRCISTALVHSTLGAAMPAVSRTEDFLLVVVMPYPVVIRFFIFYTLGCVIKPPPQKRRFYVIAISICSSVRLFVCLT